MYRELFAICLSSSNMCTEDPELEAGQKLKVQRTVFTCSPGIPESQPVSYYYACQLQDFPSQNLVSV